MRDELDPRLTELFADYRRALPDPEASPAFMPALWQRIEAREQTYGVGFRRFAQALITAAAALSLLMGAWMVWPSQSYTYSSSATYLELLASGEAHETPLDEADLVRPEERPR